MEGETRWRFSYLYVAVTIGFLFLCMCVSLMMCKDACMEMCICDCRKWLCFFLCVFVIVWNAPIIVLLCVWLCAQTCWLVADNNTRGCVFVDFLLRRFPPCSACLGSVCFWGCTRDSTSCSILLLASSTLPGPRPSPTPPSLRGLLFIW